MVLLTEPVSKIKFYNKAAERIFDLDPEARDALTVEDLNKPRFLPSKLIKENLVQETNASI